VLGDTNHRNETADFRGHLKLITKTRAQKYEVVPLMSIWGEQPRLTKKQRKSLEKQHNQGENGQQHCRKFMLCRAYRAPHINYGAR